MTEKPDRREYDLRADISDPKISWCAEWSNDSPDDVIIKTVETGTGFFFRTNPVVADYIVECVNRCKALADWSDGIAKILKQYVPREEWDELYMSDILEALGHD